MHRRFLHVAVDALHQLTRARGIEGLDVEELDAFVHQLSQDGDGRLASGELEVLTEALDQ